MTEISPFQQAKVYEWLWNHVYPDIIAYEQQVTEYPTLEQINCWKHNRPYNIDIRNNLIYVSLSDSCSNLSNVVIIVDYCYNDSRSYTLNI